MIFAAMGVAGEGGDEILEYGARVVAEITDVDGIPIDVSLTPARANVSTEQIVEGHTVFHTIDMIREPARNITEISLSGLVECYYNVDGLGIPNIELDRVRVECHVGGRIWMSDSESANPRSPLDLEPTGWERVVERPDTREPVLVVEYAYWTERLNERGELEAVRAYCWETRILPTGDVPATGKPFNFIATLNMERLAEMGTDRVSVTVDDAFFRVSG